MARPLDVDWQDGAGTLCHELRIFSCALLWALLGIFVLSSCDQSETPVENESVAQKSASTADVTPDRVGDPDDPGPGGCLTCRVDGQKVEVCEDTNLDGVITLEDCPEKPPSGGGGDDTPDNVYKGGCPDSYEDGQNETGALGPCRIMEAPAGSPPDQVWEANYVWTSGESGSFERYWTVAFDFGHKFSEPIPIIKGQDYDNASVSVDEVSIAVGETIYGMPAAQAFRLTMQAENPDTGETVIRRQDVAIDNSFRVARYGGDCGASGDFYPFAEPAEEGGVKCYQRGCDGEKEFKQNSFGEDGAYESCPYGAYVEPAEDTE